MNARECARGIVDELDCTLRLISMDAAERLADGILDAGRIFLAGAGRSGFMARAFAMRLMHMGLAVHVVGEAVTPGFEAGDLLLVCSGSGETASLVAMADKARQLGGTLALVTIFPDSTIGRAADVVVAIPAPTPKSETDSGFHSIQPMGSLFEQSLLLLLDILIMRLMEKRGRDAETMFRLHANLE